MTVMSTPAVSPLESAVEEHIDSTSRLVRKVDLALALLVGTSLILGGLFLAILADHWLLKDGLSTTLRFAIFGGLATIAGLYTYWKILPIFQYQINPVYTADLIERDVHTFKNSLINWLLLRQERSERDDLPQDKINARMFDGIVQTAAAKVQAVPIGHAVDFRKLIWVGTFFAILLILFVAYAAFSPKNSFASIARVMLPFGNIERPQTAQFRNVEPGDATVLQGEMIVVSAEVVSPSPEPVYLVFSTDDGQAVQQRIPMLMPEGRIAFETQFPPGRQGSQRGFNSSVDYWIAQGESRSRQYRIDVQPAASIEIVSLQYDFPDYTGLPTEIVEHSSDVKALEGTAISIAVRSTLPLETINLVFDDNPASNVAMRITNSEKTEAQGTFTLRNPFPHRTFAFQATDANGNASRRSGIHRIEVIPDQPPRIQWADTAEHLRDVAEINLPINEALPLPIQAEDPDFALRYIRFKTEAPGKRIPDSELLADSPRTGPTEHRGQISRTYNFSPTAKRLAVGDTVDVWVEAVDTKLPEANESATRRIKINVVEPTQQDETQKDQESDQEQNGEGDGTGDGQSDSGDSSNEESPDGTAGEGNQGGEADAQNPQESEGQNPAEGGEGRDDSGQEEGQDGEGQEGAGQDGDGASGGGQQEEQSGESGGGNAGSESSDAGGDQVQEGDPQNGTGSDEQSAQTPEEQAGASGGEEGQNGQGQGGESQPNAPESNTPGQNAPVNPETQDGDAMERIIEQMKQEGRFPEEDESASQNDNPRERSDSLDPDSQNRSNQGSDPTDPRASSEPSEGTPQDGEGESGDGTEAETGQSEMTEGGEGQQGEGQQGEGQQSGGQQGEGQQSGGQQGEGQQSGGQQGEGQQGEGQSGEGSSASPSPQNGGQQDANPGNQQGSPQAGGTDGGSGVNLETPPDDPNLEYANQATNLVLEYLEDQLKDTPSDELLNRLGWTEEQLRQFYARWQKMSQDSKRPLESPDQESGRSAWEEALRSLGLLRPNRDRAVLRGGSQSGLRDNRSATESQRIEPPASLRERVRTYNENIGR